MNPEHVAPTDNAALADPAQISVVRGAVAGVAAAGAALATTELVASLLGSDQTMVTAIGSEFIDRYAATLKDLAVAVFGTNDKPALLIGIVVVSLAFGGLLGVLTRRRRWVLPVGFALFASVGAFALATDPQGSVGIAVVTAVAACVVGVVVHAALVGSWFSAESSTTPASSATTLSRRRFVAGVGAVVVVGSAMTMLARQVRADRVADAVRRLAGLPVPTRRTAIPAPSFAVDGLSPYITPTADFYRIDTALTTPRIDPATWSLSINGMVDRPFTISYDDLLAMDSVEVPVTIQCVSNNVGGDLVGTAVWQGVPLATLLERAGVEPAATQVVGRSVDGWTAGFPTAAALDGRTALVAYAMNGEALPFAHGFPARLVVAGLYGYVSATKWLTEIELTTWEQFDGYWVPRGWSKEGPIKLTSRLDVPRSGERVAAGSVVLAGVAWSPNVGISAVEVAVDDGPWQLAELGATASADTWVQWRLLWDATPGAHRIRVRAIDARGTAQIEEPSEPAPDGATGLHTRTVVVT